MFQFEILPLGEKLIRPGERWFGFRDYVAARRNGIRDLKFYDLDQPLLLANIGMNFGW